MLTFSQKCISVIFCYHHSLLCPLVSPTRCNIHSLSHVVTFPIKKIINDILIQSEKNEGLKYKQLLQINDINIFFRKITKNLRKKKVLKIYSLFKKIY